MNRRAIIATAVAVPVLGGGAVYAAQPRGQAADVMRISAQPAGALFNAANLNPGQTVTRCVRISNDAAVAAHVFLHSTRGDGDLAQHMHLTVQAGEQPAGPDLHCAGFLPESAAPLFDGPLTAFPADEDSALADPQRYPAGYQRAYRFEVSVDASTDQGLELNHETFSFSAEPADPPVAPMLKTRDELPELTVDLPAAPAPAPATPSVTRSTPSPTSAASVLSLDEVKVSPAGEMRLMLHATSPGRLVVRGHLVRSQAQPLRKRASVRPARRTTTPTAAAAIAQSQHIHIGTNRVVLELQRAAIRRVRRHPGRYAIRLTTRLTTADLVALRHARIPNPVLRALAARAQGR